MALESQSLNFFESTTLANTGIQLPLESIGSHLSQEVARLQTEIQQIKETIQSLETLPIFQPPHPSIPLTERFQLHIRSIQAIKHQTQRLAEQRSLLVAKQAELVQAQDQLHRYQSKVRKAMKRLETLAQTVLRAEQAYHQVYEEFQAAASKAQKALLDSCGSSPTVSLEESDPKELPGSPALPQLAPAG
ncbi:MAG: hypothetical protein ACFBSC_13540 [Microcoleaceae cyanobacterium]